MSGNPSPSRSTKRRFGSEKSISGIDEKARKGAQSFHLDPSPRYPDRPSINYARGNVIVMTMKPGAQGGVDRVDVQGLQDGIQLEASDAPPADSLKSRGDSLSRAPGSR